MQVPEARQNPSNDFSVNELQRATRAGSLWEVLRLVKAAGEQCSAEAVPYLSAVLRKKDRWRERLSRHRPLRLEIKFAAVEALQKIGNLAAAEGLAIALFDSEDSVNRAASRALCSFGSDAVPPLLQMLERRAEWTVPQMRLLMQTLSEINDPRGGPGLARVLLGVNPRESSRWFRNTVPFPAALSMLIMGLLFFVSFLSTSAGENAGVSIISLLICLTFSMAAGAIIGIVLFLPVYFFFLMPVGLLWSNRERGMLAETAADVLTGLRDKRSLPSVIEAACVGRRSSQSAARRALIALLPLLTAEDRELLPRPSLQLLLDALQPMKQFLEILPSDLTAAIVHSLRHVGPGSAADTIEKLGKNSDSSQVRIACRAVLPTLQARREQERAASTLLRASAQPAIPNQQLLRAAASPPAANPNELLRPSE